MEEDAVASWLIGSIVEKGISEKPSPPSFPTPYVLPFPVARHRSHGPHWGSIRCTKHQKQENDYVDDNDEDESSTGVDTIAAFAKPVHRVKKKSLDVSKWREMARNDTAVTKKREAGRFVTETKNQNKPVESIEIMEEIPCDEKEKAPIEIMEEVEKPLSSMLTTREFKPFKSATNSSSAPNYSDNCTTLQSEIDAENRALLQGMSQDEIEQTRAELMEKLDPALLEILKRRGREKSKSHNKSCSDLVSNGGKNNSENGNTNVSPLIKKDISHMTTNASTNETGERLNSVSVQKSEQAKDGLWNAWNQRVESVRHLRFSLDGDAIKNNIVQRPNNGGSSTHSDYNADNVAERDFLRTEGDPGAAGYTIKEAVALTRSVIPGQRALALHLIASVLSKALHNIHQKKIGHNMNNASNIDKTIDWEAIWAFALGPDPELVLALRLCLDDNHSSVVTACAKAIQCILSCDVNENFFEMLQKTSTCERASVCTAPVFRTRPQVDTGFLQGGIWKYNAKPSNILPIFLDEKAEEEHTIQDDIYVAGQDVAAGLVRMGILPKLMYILEEDPTITLEESVISILIAIAQHSPVCANAIIKCQRLVQTVVNRFTKVNATKIYSAKIKSVTLIRVLAQSSNKYCRETIENGTFNIMMWHLYRPAISIYQWIQLGREHCKVASALMVEELRLWKLCINYGYCVSYFSDFFPALCMWLNPPTFENLIENNVLQEFVSISMEAYLVLEALARKLPCIHAQRNLSSEALSDTENWSWSHVTPMINLALKWIEIKNDTDTIQSFESKNSHGKEYNSNGIFVTPLLWVISSVMLMLSSVLDRVATDDPTNLNGRDGSVPWLPEFVPKIGLGIIKNNFLSLLNMNSFVEDICNLSRHSEYETPLASICFLHGLVRVVVSIDGLIRAAKMEPIHASSLQQYDSSREGKILEDGILEWSLVELRTLFTNLMHLVDLEWKYVQSIEIFGRGGPAPGIGLGWGASGGGFWSEATLLAQISSQLLVYLHKIFKIEPTNEPPPIEETTFTIQRIQSALSLCLIVGPRDRSVMENALDILLQVPTLKFLYRFITSNGKFRQFQWEYNEEDFIRFNAILSSHFRNRWLCNEKKIKAVNDDAFDFSKMKKLSTKLNTILEEEVDTSNTKNQDPYDSLSVEWAHQRLPVPSHWFLSPISTVYDSSQIKGNRDSKTPIIVTDPTFFLELVRGGLFLLFGIEAISSFQPTDLDLPIKAVPLIWKLHSLSIVLLNGMSVLEDQKSRDVYETLQELYGILLSENNESLVTEKEHYFSETLRFQSEIHESYSTFVETLVEQFSAVSYGDIIYARQVAIYLHRGVESSVRLTAWNALSNNHVLELLPPLDNCLGHAEGYLEPVENDEGILEAYMKSWVSGALDRAATRRSASYTLVLHHLSSFIFQQHHDHISNDQLLARNKFAKSLLRDYSRKSIHESMMLDFIRYKKLYGLKNDESEITRRMQILAQVCEESSSLLTVVEKLKSLI